MKEKVDDLITDCAEKDVIQAAVDWILSNTGEEDHPRILESIEKVKQKVKVAREGDQ